MEYHRGRMIDHVHLVVSDLKTRQRFCRAVPRSHAAFVLDPDGNNIEAVHHGPADKSADSIRRPR